ncbi:N-acetylmuramoyl-L-alanine amidase [Jatrophihabitans endophyticus]|uniref:N-acetylmuramoyl-L-alanine amidase n=1 Tax=Jatrophihabitans endophyticus TaxID=1206085 RepID=A0A1M5HUX8_9ACTN|nr:N-acetylmuramoyl-L-alanine amidase [Jatrophihabitans endophyticus]SHG19759.1 N-acetylmuramoyl-L-alanine amidase [Jatrophihabitans endophyticus]
MQPLRRGMTGSAVAEVRTMLATIGLLNNTESRSADSFDEATELAVRHFQQRRGISVDGRVGDETYAALTGAHWKLGDRVLAHESGHLLTGDDVTELQTQLVELGFALGKADGVFGPSTAEALRGFQRDYGLIADGICGLGTLRALRQLGRRVVGGRPQLLRDMMAVADAGPSLLGKRIVIDAGHGGADRGVVADGVSEADLVWDIASRLEGRFAALGVQAWPTRGPHTGPSEQERAQFANDIGADLVVSLHVDGWTSPQAHGVAAYYYGAGESTSTIGERLADLAQREVVARTGLGDNRIHGKTWALLRLTRMPTVRVELGYLTATGDRLRLCDTQVRDAIAEGLLVAIQRLYLPTADDPPTGVMRISA